MQPTTNRTRVASTGSTCKNQKQKYTMDVRKLKCPFKFRAQTCIEATFKVWAFFLLAFLVPLSLVFLLLNLLQYLNKEVVMRDNTSSFCVYQELVCVFYYKKHFPGTKPMLPIMKSVACVFVLCAETCFTPEIRYVCCCPQLTISRQCYESA